MRNEAPKLAAPWTCLRLELASLIMFLRMLGGHNAVRVSGGEVRAG
jgi:hypothetical protein